MTTPTLRQHLESWPADRVREMIAAARDEDVARALQAASPTLEDLAALLSPRAACHLEPLAQEAHRRTRRQFGRTIGLYVPLYISNVCASDCIYCGYAAGSRNKAERRTLTADEIRIECGALAARGFRQVLLLTGESRRAAPVSAIAEAVSVARETFPSVSVEVYALEESDYRCLVDRGLEGVTLYMETYDPTTYATVHRRGEKRDYDHRLEAIERAGRGGVRRLSVGALLGLYEWRLDGFWTALHARYLQKVCWQSAISVSFPRLRHETDRFTIPYPVSDRELVQLILAMRLFLPEVGFNLSTRERPELRDRLIPLGITMMSAGSSTRPGGYSLTSNETLQQFEIEDPRPPEEIAAVIARAGYDPVWKDFDYAFHAPGQTPVTSSGRAAGGWE